MGGNLTSASSGPRVFISYGRKDASDLATKLQSELSKKDFDVWIDTSKLRAGRAWEQQIIDGLRSTDVVIALLSPHSTRQDDAESGDSVCLDELAWARYAQPPTPIVPVLAVRGASIPLTIFRLHYLDFVDSLSSESLFQQRCEELVDAVHGVLRGRVQYRSWDSWLTLGAEFDRFLYSKRNRFSGRDWLFKQIDSWRKSGTEPALLIRGDPGIGKSAIIAELAYGRLGAASIATYCCQFDVLETLRPATFVRSVAYQFASRLPQYADQIERPEIRRILEMAELDPSSAFELGVLDPLARLKAPFEDPSFLCIDALDEAVTFKEGLSIVSLLESRIDRLPSWLKIIATTRNDKAVMRQLGGIRATAIDASGEENIKDLKTYVANRLKEPTILAALNSAGIGSDAFSESLIRRCEGNFLYAEHFLQGISRGRIKPAELGDLPPGLDGTYEHYLRRAFPNSNSVDQIRPVLECLCAAAGPIPRPLLAEAAGQSEHALVKMLAPLTAFLRQESVNDKELQIAFWHKSFYDFLTRVENADSDFGIDQEKGDETLASLFVDRWLKNKAGVDFRTTIASVPTYLRRRGLDHLALCGRFFRGLSDEEVTYLVRCSSWDFGSIAVGGLWTFAPAFVTKAVATERVDAIERLLDALNVIARDGYVDSGLLALERQPDGPPEWITATAKNSGPLSAALIATGLAVSVVDQVFAQRGADSAFSTVVRKLDPMQDTVRRVDVEDGLSGYFVDQADALDTMISNLKNHRRAQSWK